MAYQGYLYIDSKRQGGLIESDLESDLHEGAIVFQEFSHNIQVPGEAGLQRMSVKPVHKPITITKDVDKTTPNIYRAFLSYDTLKVDMKWYEMIDGEEELVYTIRLKNAHVVGINTLKHDIRQDSYSSYGITEEVSFSYKSIAWEYEVDEGDSYFEFDDSVNYGKNNNKNQEEADDDAPARE